MLPHRAECRCGWTRGHETLFNEAAETHDEVRPSYPADLFDSLFDLLPFEPEIVEAGPRDWRKATTLLARASVHAIEIGPAMAAKLRSNLPTNRLRVSIDDFEAQTVATASADAVFSATAYH